MNGFPACGLGVCIATDSTLFQSEVFAASHSPDALLRARLVAPSRGQREVNVVYRGAEASDQNRATDASYAQPQSKPQEKNMGSNAPMMDQSPNNSDQPQPQK